MAAAAQHATEWPVCIVGGGPTGLTAANLLGAAGVRVLLLECNESTSVLSG